MFPHFSTFEHFDCATYSVQACHCSSKFLSVRQMSEIHRTAQGQEIEKKKTNKQKKKHVPHYYLVTWEIHLGPILFPACILMVTSLSAYKAYLKNLVIQPIHTKFFDFLKTLWTEKFFRPFVSVKWKVELQRFKFTNQLFSQTSSLCCVFIVMYL